MPGIRDDIFKDGTGDVSALYCENYNYGSYQPLANLTVSIANIGAAKSYKRELDLETALYTDMFTSENVDYKRFAAYSLSARCNR